MTHPRPTHRDPGARPMVLTFVAPSTRHPSGGVAVVYEFACAMARRGHAVHLLHGGFFQGEVRGLDDIEWFDFDAPLMHHFAPDGMADDAVPDADVHFGLAALRPSLRRIGLPVVMIQGYGMLGTELEAKSYRAPCPKVCVATWLADIARGLGVPERELIHVPVGLRTEKYRLRRPIADRPPRIAYCYSAHRQKGASLALEIFDEVRTVVPEVEVTVFGAVAPEHEIPDWMTYRTNPPQSELVDEIYNQSQVVLCTSEVEGFGLSSVEAMACGAALVTTDNGGSGDYAIHGRTALVAPCGDRGALVDHVVTLLRDHRRCAELATAGQHYVQRFQWDRSGELLEEFLVGYVADPVRFGRPGAGEKAGAAADDG